MRTPDLRLPPDLEQLVTEYADCKQKPVEIHPTTWARKWPDHPSYTSRLQPAVTRDDLKVVADVRLSDQEEVLSAFVLVMAWGGGTSGRPMRNTQRALADPVAAHAMLESSAQTLRDAVSVDDGALEAAYGAWSLSGVGRSFFTKWFAFAGWSRDRKWQPLILDDRVFATLNKTLNRSTIELAGGRRRSRRYRAYVQAMHEWAGQLQDRGHDVDAKRLEWILFAHNGRALAG
ncbi:hypothetical protein BWI15_19120 [Kribbella sp. ALI-6-A]|uniref:8-oxoguanine DNA glycosylase OGG fold protein n=1 Tax=Kribbella sp. ALI-6-A TaxID=1933817 RepID=UPI00097C7A90|nr:hypothetical protein [Kribbella sp. ALI-6-A]ONI72183.1 hypothetical protein BWI15_19120 [Kribbella sp. ALI-6-A]